MAGFAGASIRQAYWYPEAYIESGTLAPVTYTVGSQVESTNDYFSVDIADNTIRISFNSTLSFFPASFSGPVFTDWNGTLGDITGVSLGTTMPGLDIGDIAWDANSIRINWTGLPFDPSYSILLTVAISEPVGPFYYSFTSGSDGTAARPVDFNLFTNPSYVFTGARYEAQGGNDFVVLPNLSSVSASNPWDYSRTFTGGPDQDVIQGGDGPDIVVGGSGNDWIYGGGGNDWIRSGEGNDTLSGGAGADTLTGGGGRDIFVLTDSELGTTRTAGQHDILTDFKSGTDKVDISDLYDGLAFAGLLRGRLSGDAASQMKAAFYMLNGKGWLEGDVTGDGRADFVVEVGSSKLVVGDLIVTHGQWDTAFGASDYAWSAFHTDYLLPLG
jgi:hypothetical protein